MLDAERAAAGPRRDVCGPRLPTQREGDVAAVAAAVDQHEGTA